VTGERLRSTLDTMGANPLARFLLLERPRDVF
jgi:hypothetical protein